ncbi:MAG: hypothetical protein WA977_08715 [Halobacteriota archaeon]
MKDLEINDRIEIALSIVLKNDAYLLQKNINERTIAHKLATYLQYTFPEYHVDCEYNGNVLGDNEKKYIILLKKDLQRLLPKPKEEIIDKEIIERLVYPDIVIHKRGIPENLCIIEIKKSTSKIPSDYDELKLKCYTSNDNDNDLKYKLGIFIKFSAGVSKPTYTLKWYRKGTEISERSLAADYA